MDAKDMKNEKLVDTLATLAIRMDEVDLDLIGSCRRLSVIVSGYRDELLSRMEGSMQANSNMLQDFMQSAVISNTNGDEASIQQCLAQRQEILDKIPIEIIQQEILTAVG